MPGGSQVGGSVRKLRTTVSTRTWLTEEEEGGDFKSFRRDSQSELIPRDSVKHVSEAFSVTAGSTEIADHSGDGSGFMKRGKEFTAFNLPPV